MLGEVKNYSSNLNSYILKFKKYINDRTLITDLLTKFTITFGVVLIIGGLYLMMTDPAASTQVAQTNSATQSVVSVMDWIPGIPFYISSLVNAGATAIGLVSWILGIDFLLVGLGFWVRNRIARLIGLMIFILAAIFQFVQFLYLGILGSPTSIIEFLVDGIFVYFLFSKFESQTDLRKQLIS
jgi:hypothetical protein